MDNNKRPENMARINNEELASRFIDQQVEEIREQVGDKKVLLALSGGVDSSVVAALLIKAIGKQLVCVHVNHGLLRKGEPEQVVEVFRGQMNANLVYVDAVDRFLDKLAAVAEPEKKSRIIAPSSFFVLISTKCFISFVVFGKLKTFPLKSSVISFVPSNDIPMSSGSLVLADIIP
jgi:GMP synthase (glutamine-hydrolysing) B subunit